MAKKNCWEYKKCGREPGGNKVDDLGVCPTTAEKRLDGANGGKNAGRACWAVAGTMCEGKIQGTFADKQLNCLECDFWRQVVLEEGNDFLLTEQLLARME